MVLAHALKNAAVPVVTLIGLQFGTLLGGAVVTETIFAWPGVGRLAVQSIFVRDYPVVQAGVFVLALSSWPSTWLVDLLYGYARPAHPSRSVGQLDGSTRVTGARRRRRRSRRAGRWSCAAGCRWRWRWSPRWRRRGSPRTRPRRASWARASGRRPGRGGELARLLGTDLLGRDVLSRLIWGARVSLLDRAGRHRARRHGCGSLIGLVAGYYRGRVDRVVTKLIDVQLAFPFVLLAIAVIAVAGPVAFPCWSSCWPSAPGWATRASCAGSC